MPTPPPASHDPARLSQCCLTECFIRLSTSNTWFTAHRKTSIAPLPGLSIFTPTKVSRPTPAPPASCHAARGGSRGVIQIAYHSCVTWVMPSRRWVNAVVTGYIRKHFNLLYESLDWNNQLLIILWLSIPSNLFFLLIYKDRPRLE